MEHGTWLLNVPAYVGGTYARESYNIGFGRAISKDSETGRMQMIGNTTREEFDAYEDLLVRSGYRKISENEIGQNRYIEYAKDGAPLFASYVHAFGEARVIEDNTSVPSDEFCYTYEPKEGDSIALYQYGLMHDPRGYGEGQDSDGKYGNCGMFYIIRLSDNGLILIDGGDGRQATPRATEELVKFLYRITKTPEDQKLRIAAVIVTHAHLDHKRFIENLLQDYSDRIVIERALHNLPSYSEINGSATFPELGTHLLEKFPDLLYHKAHTGQKLRLGDLELEVVYTHEDMIDAETGKTHLTECNNSSIVLKCNLNGRTVMLLGDVGGGNKAPVEYDYWERRILDGYREGERYPFLESETVQIAHHAINYYMEPIYAAIKARIALFTQADVEYDMFAYKCYRAVVDQVRAAGAKELYFEGRATTCLEVQRDGKLRIEFTPIAGADDGYLDLVERYRPFNH